MRPGSASKFIQERLFDCVCLCDSVYEVYDRYCESSQRADEGSSFSDQIDSIFPRCWQAIRGLTTIPLPPPVPSVMDSIDQKAHRVDELRRWAVSNNDTQFLAVDVVSAIERATSLISRAYQELPVSERSSSQLERFFGGVDRRLEKLIQACKFAEVGYTRKSSGGDGRTEMIYKLRQINSLAIEHRKELARHQFPSDADQGSRQDESDFDPESEFYWRGIFDPGWRTERYRSFVRFAEGLNSELTGISKEKMIRRRKSDKRASPEDMRRIYDLLKSNPKTPAKALLRQVNERIKNGEFDKKDEFTYWNSLKNAAQTHAKRLGIELIEVRR